jgi:hypothetical protein
MIKLVKKGHLLNGYDHDVEQYSATFETKYQASCSRRTLTRYGWMVKRAFPGARCDVVAYRRLK